MGPPSRPRVLRNLARRPARRPARHPTRHPTRIDIRLESDSIIDSTFASTLLSFDIRLDFQLDITRGSKLRLLLSRALSADLLTAQARRVRNTPTSTHHLEKIYGFLPSQLVLVSNLDDEGAQFSICN